MVSLLISLIVIYTRIGIGLKEVNLKETWLIHIPFSTYLGWITVATVANAAYVLYDAGWNGLGISGEVWATVMLLVATGIVLTIIVTRKDIAYTAVIVWAFAGITVKQTDTPLVALTAAVMALIVIATLLGSRLNGRSRPRQSIMAGGIGSGRPD